jgi:hypothetical protein
MNRETIELYGVAWPDPHPETREPFVEVTAFERRSNDQIVHHCPPSPPERRIATAWETAYNGDGEEYEEPTAWRDLDDDEWAAALAAYERVKGNTMAIVRGQETIEGRFVTASGAYARGMYAGSWRWFETGHG